MKTKNNSCNKLIAVLIVFVIMISEIILIPTNAYAAIDDLEKQGNIPITEMLTLMSILGRIKRENIV